MLCQQYKQSFPSIPQRLLHSSRTSLPPTHAIPQSIAILLTESIELRQKCILDPRRKGVTRTSFATSWWQLPWRTPLALHQISRRPFRSQRGQRHQIKSRWQKLIRWTNSGSPQLFSSILFKTGRISMTRLARMGSTTWIFLLTPKGPPFFLHLVRTWIRSILTQNLRIRVEYLVCLPDFAAEDEWRRV